MSHLATRRLLTRTLDGIRSTWREISGTAHGRDATLPRRHRRMPDAEPLRRQMHACLAARGGDVSARAQAAALARAYGDLDAAGRGRFLTILADNFDINERALVDAAWGVIEAEVANDLRAAEQILRRTLAAPRVILLKRFGALPDGVKLLIDMRAELLSLPDRSPSLDALDHDLKELLATWLDIGFLELRRITWDTAPATLLENLIRYEAVHAIGSWSDLRNRLDSDRRCFAFLHPRLPLEPLIFVEVALVNGLAGDITGLLDEMAPVVDPRHADTAIFYSISNTQKGLAGIGFGNCLIKQVVDELSRDFKNIQTFATLSPVPGFRDWLDRATREGAAPLLMPDERRALRAAAERARLTDATLSALLANPTWADDPLSAEVLRPILMRLCARYLLNEKDPAGRAMDPVAHFHLSNGARLERLNWLADRSRKGIENSAGIMVNYVYALGDIEDNHEAYAADGRVDASSAVRVLAKK